jgi:hypothetical protein
MHLSLLLLHYSLENSLHHLLVLGTISALWNKKHLSTSYRFGSKTNSITHAAWSCTKSFEDSFILMITKFHNIICFTYLSAAGAVNYWHEKDLQSDGMVRILCIQYCKSSTLFRWRKIELIRHQKREKHIIWHSLFFDDERVGKSKKE